MVVSAMCFLSLANEDPPAEVVDAMATPQVIAHATAILASDARRGSQECDTLVAFLYHITTYYPSAAQVVLADPRLLPVVCGCLLDATADTPPDYVARLSSLAVSSILSKFEGNFVYLVVGFLCGVSV
jgi:hypothetical protein